MCLLAQGRGRGVSASTGGGVCLLAQGRGRGVSASTGEREGCV